MKSVRARVPGDWVRATAPGIWRLMREIPEHYEPRYSLETRQTVFEGRLWVLKRLVDNQWKKRFAIEALEESLIKPISQADVRKLELFCEANPDLVAQFDAFNKTLDLILNLSFSLAKKSDFREFKEHFEQAFADVLEPGVSNDTILKIIGEGPYAAAYCQTPRTATLQFVCRDFEIKRRHFVYRQLNVCDF